MVSKREKRARRDIERSRYDLEGFEPVEMASRTPEERGSDEVEVIHAFSIDGKQYFMPTSVPFHMATKSLDIAANQGEAAAMAYQLRALLGQEGYRALMDFEDIEEDDFLKISDLANRIIMSSYTGGKAR